MDAYIHIPKPCNENWNDMLPVNKGRHCLQCNKAVIDFTDWEAPEITAYLKAHVDTKVCGRFRQEQLAAPVIEAVQRIYHANLSLLKKVAAVFLIAFGLTASSCSPRTMQSHTTGKIATVDSTADNDMVQIIAGQIHYVPNK